jgi:hypothetical protein
VTVDFNNPLSGKIITYDFKVERMIEDIKDKVAIVISLFLPVQNPEVKLEGKKATVVVSFKIPDQISDIIKKKAKELLDVELSFEVKEIKETKGAKENNEKKEEKSKNATEKSSEKKE